MLGNLEKYVMKLTYSIHHQIIHSKSVYNGECGINNEVKSRFLKCLGNNSYLSELFLAGNCNFHCKTHSEIAEPCCARVVKCFYSAAEVPYVNN